jgi:serine/threonine-protein kinase HipA
VEATALSLAAKAGIKTTDWRMETVAGRSVLLVRRFDRRDGQRIPFLSAMACLARRTAIKQLHGNCGCDPPIRRECR